MMRLDTVSHVADGQFARGRQDGFRLGRPSTIWLSMVISFSPWTTMSPLNMGRSAGSIANNSL